MTYEFNSDDSLLNNFPNPFRFENAFLLLAAAATGTGGIATFVTAKELFKNHEDRAAFLGMAVAILVLGAGVKLLIQALSQLRFYLGQKFPRGLADELPITENGVGLGTEKILETLRQRAIEFPEPKGALNGVLYSLVKNLATSPVEVQTAAVQHFHAMLEMAALFTSLVFSFFVFEGTPYEGFASWLYLPMSGLSLLTLSAQLQNFAVPDGDDADAVETGNRALWKLMCLIMFSIIAPVLVPRIAPHLTIAPMWIPPALLLVGSMVASGLFFGAVVSRLDSVAATSVSCEQTTIGMNCPPAQLWTAISRDFQSAWECGIPNRAYANIPPESPGGERGSFGGFVVEETQPVPTTTLQFLTWGEAFKTPYSRFLLLLGTWGVMLATACAWAGVHFTAQFVHMPRMEISRSILIVIALGMVAMLSFRIGHLLWSRMQFKSRLFWIETSGMYQTSQIRIGNQFRSHAQSSSTLTRVEDATLRVWVTDTVSVAFGKEGKRSIIAMASADSVAKSLTDRLVAFAANQSVVTALTSDRDFARSASICSLNGQHAQGQRRT